MLRLCIQLKSEDPRYWSHLLQLYKMGSRNPFSRPSKIEFWLYQFVILTIVLDPSNCSNFITGMNVWSNFRNATYASRLIFKIRVLMTQSQFQLHYLMCVTGAIWVLLNITESNHWKSTLHQILFQDLLIGLSTERTNVAWTW